MLVRCTPPPTPTNPYTLSCPTKAMLRLANKHTSGVPGAGWQPVCECFWWGLILKPYKDGIRAQAYTTRKKIESLERNMRLIPFCHQWILKIVSRSVKLFVITMVALLESALISRGKKWPGSLSGVLSHISKTSRFLKASHHSVEKTPSITSCLISLISEGVILFYSLINFCILCI